MSKLNISKSEKIKIFLNEYYFGYGIFYSILRIVCGPLILLMGLNQYFDESAKFGTNYSGIFIIFGIYYILRPLITILTKNSWFENFDLDYSIEPEKIIIKSDKSKSELDYSELDKILKRKSYFALKTKSKQGIYLPIKSLNQAEVKILDGLKH
ncbi:YcxB family protein [Aquimarina sp. MMG016]|uniref:YcxB family protein n=1 Tax=Aquimarina sp. MMG016 TaxID=2822690 RepID=UPI001B39D574|nr:YcxB family protein [Aquimarina sp. MMG016]MBQ4822780.1 YcxB family protein [Aquimarina sp. MMG016]